ncbi:DUF3298 and DUF4163 domain-containing protein [Hymenobacter sp. CRA2]|uniref:DUF3298 and DUF4163 domain-containing protein n=1 Tax=Hymenobacter sp. CRA2 TaxID=1955620 RepID=UPI00098F02A8|nr:DUF3298 and DUF4163 domain-containing protein [Hymenobacter sp. CRA2]OON69721.1 hypothetical protein B0919_07275 [Hymenobacter sp. CRA2]
MSSLSSLSRVLGAAALLTACNSQPDKQATTQARRPAPAATAEAASANPPGAWYRQYRGLLPGTTDSLTLHLTSIPAEGSTDDLPRLYEAYIAPDGEPQDVAVELTTEADLKPVPEDEDSGPVLRVREDGNELVGFLGMKPVRLRRVKPVGSLHFVAHFFTDSVAAFPGKSSSPYAHQTLHVLLPIDGPAPLTAGILRTLRGDTTDAKPAPVLKQYWQEQQRSYARDYRADAADFASTADDSTEMPSYALRYDSQELTYVLWNQAPLLSLGFMDYSYTGGAHGNYGTRVISFDTRSGRALRYADIFRAGSEARLEPILDRAVRRIMHLAPTDKLDETLLVDRIHVTHNVYLTSGGAMFVYQPYELASYAQGEIRVYLPFAELQPLLQPGLPVGAAADVALLTRK